MRPYTAVFNVVKRRMSNRVPRSRRERSDAIDDLTRIEREGHQRMIAAMECNGDDLILIDKIRAMGLGRRRRAKDGRLRQAIRIESTSTAAGYTKLIQAADCPGNLPNPKSGNLEIAIVGHSNSGKSSLINALTGRGPWSTLRKAAVSDRPGWTQNVNFFQMGLPAVCYLVDCPGYGHAIAHAVNQKRWETTLYKYIQFRSESMPKVLKYVCILIDCTRGISKLDVEFMDYLESRQTKFQLILTKADLLTEEEVNY